MSIQNYIEKKLKDKDFRKQYNEYDLYYEIGHLITEARLHKGLTQDKLANLIGTDQSSIARAESGRTLPSLTFLSKIAGAIGTYLIAPKFAFMVENETKSASIMVGDSLATTSPSVTLFFFTSPSQDGQPALMQSADTLN